MVDKYTHDLGRKGARWEEVKRLVFATQTHCWRCGRYVDQSLPPNDRMSRTVGHVVALADGGRPLDLDNLRLEHRSCNSKAGRAMQARLRRSESL
ncbi:HNH endonuclease [Nonomuraea sp. NPDC050786]|uniref:HNH endonuclease n=1 Tax=Nonomuraea sp. NPDC050786 TaxID=3154840 RepID=UPI0033D20634